MKRLFCILFAALLLLCGCMKNASPVETTPIDRSGEEDKQAGQSDSITTSVPEEKTAPVFDGLCIFIDGEMTYVPYENWLWSNCDNGLCADGYSFKHYLEQGTVEIPTIQNPTDLSVKGKDGIESVGLQVYDASLNHIGLNVDAAYLKALEPGTYYISADVKVREDAKISGYECVCRLEISASVDEN